MKFSLILPIYNISYELIDKCLNSIINQNHKDWECVFVNDGSNKNFNYKKHITKKFGNDKRFIFINQPNKGLAISRNNGYLKSNGDLIWFIDPDDYIKENSFEIINNLFNQDIDFINFNYIENFGNKLKERKKNFKKSILVEMESADHKLFNSWHTSWRNVYRREFLEKNNLLHQNKKVTYEDIYWDLITKASSKRALLITENLYYYNRVRCDSICNKKKKFKEKLRTFVENINEAYIFIKKNKKNVNSFNNHLMYYYPYIPFLLEEIKLIFFNFYRTNKKNFSAKEKISILISKSKFLTKIYYFLIIFIVNIKWFFIKGS